ncbi:hypothetical protein BFG52_02555 [Acinetobacter larvae]|uniref:Copper resistance protein CopB n=2 Tax=Acinetobacter larvae TaxID=1789224 RepID=A0A1B2LWN0_9GAMM|nr:hypothetical protein BFG52_02555 [Acinetobacter larvae]
MNRIHLKSIGLTSIRLQGMHWQSIYLSNLYGANVWRIAAAIVLLVMSMVLMLAAIPVHAATAGDAHLHGGEVYQRTDVHLGWQTQQHDHDTLQGRLESRIGTDQHKLYLDASVEKTQSEPSEKSLSALYSRNMTTFWDVQAGMRYRHQADQPNASDRYDAVIGINGLAPYFFETKAHLYMGKQLQVAVEFERDLLLTQRFIVQPYVEANVILHDASRHALDRGLSEFTLGVQTRYEINKMFMPYWEFGYRYQQQLQQQAEQTHVEQKSESNWFTGLGMRFLF